MNKMISNSGIITRQKLLNLSKEAFRKSIHLCSAFIPCLLDISFYSVLVGLCIVVILYSVAEGFRLSGKEVFLISDITEAAARKRDENKFVLGPVTLSCGIILSSLLWHPLAASIGVYALAFGDGLASLFGKLFGRVQIPYTEGKTAAGSLTCFTAIFISCYLACSNSSYIQNFDVALFSLKIASLGMIIELLPLKDYDNVVIPVVLGGAAQSLIFMN